MTSTRWTFLAGAAVIGLAACGADTVSPSQVVRIAVIPPTVTMLPGTDTNFFAFGITSKGDTGQTTATWTASAGIITAQGRYTAPSAAGTKFVYATVGALKDSATVTVSTSPVVRIVVFPKAVTVTKGDTVTFTAHGINTLSDTVGVSVAWSATGGQINVLTGLWTADTTAGQYVIRATNGALTDSAVATISPAGPITEPTLQAGDVVSFVDSFKTFDSTQALLNAYANGATHATIALDTSTFPGNRVVKFTYDSVGCLGGNDADVDIQKKLPDGSTSTDRDWIFTFNVAYQSGYQFWWGSNIGSCIRGNANKQFLIFRDVNNTTGGRIGLIANTEPACPDFFGAPAGLAWNVNIDGETGDTLTTACTTQRVKQITAYGTKDPNSIADGKLHRITLFVRRETAQDAGDGIVAMWVDGVVVMNYNGEDATSAAYHKVYTKTLPIGLPVIFPTIFNAGAPITESLWFGNLLFYHRP